MTITETNVTVMVKDMDKAIAFYQMLGLTIKQRWDNHYAQLMTKDIIIGIHPAKEGMTPSAQVSIGFMIDNIEEAKTLLQSQHVPFGYHDDKSGLTVDFKDPDGTTLYFMQPKWK